MVANIETIGSAFHRFRYILGFFLPISGFAGFFFTALRIKIRVELCWLIIGGACIFIIIIGGCHSIVSSPRFESFLFVRIFQSMCLVQNCLFILPVQDNCLNILPKFCRRNTPRLAFLHCYIVANYCQFSNVSIFCAQFCNDQHC